MNTKQKRLIRSRVSAALRGDVIEIGFGTGLNLPHLPHLPPGVGAGVLRNRREGTRIVYMLASEGVGEAGTGG